MTKNKSSPSIDSLDNTEDKPANTRNRMIVRILVFLGIFAVIWAMFNVIPKGFNMDLNQIGNGKPAFVFVYDPNLSVSAEQMAEMAVAREQIGSEVNFIIAKLGYPEAERFIAQYGARSPDIMIFDSAGQLKLKQSALLSGDEIRQLIQASNI